MNEFTTLIVLYVASFWFSAGLVVPIWLEDKASRGARAASGVGTGPKSGKVRTHCNRDHPLSGMNVRISPDGRQRCRACERMHWRKQVEAGRDRSVPARLGVRQQVEFEQRVARGESQAKTCTDMGISDRQYERAMRAWTDLLTT